MEMHFYLHLDMVIYGNVYEKYTGHVLCMYEGSFHLYVKDVYFLTTFIMQPKELVGFIVLINQLICKFNTSVQDILENVYPVIASRIFGILPRDTIPSGPGSNTEV